MTRATGIAILVLGLLAAVAVIAAAMLGRGGVEDPPAGVALDLPAAPSLPEPPPLPDLPSAPQPAPN